MAATDRTISVRFNTLLKQLKAGRFLSTLINVNVDGKQHHVICRAVQRDVVKDSRPTSTSCGSATVADRALHPGRVPEPRKDPGLRTRRRAHRGPAEVELVVTAGEIPEKLVVDLAGTDINDRPHLEHELPAGATPTITDRDFVIANIQAPSGLRSEEGEAEAAAAAEEG